MVGHVTNPWDRCLAKFRVYGYRLKFPKRSSKKRKHPDQPSEKDMEGRLDLRDEIIFTIGGADARLGCCSHQALGR